MHYEWFPALICHILKDFSRGISRAELIQSSIVNLPKFLRNLGIVLENYIVKNKFLFFFFFFYLLRLNSTKRISSGIS